MNIIKEIDNQIAYYYRNGYRLKDIGAKVGLTDKQVKRRLQTLRQKNKIVRWWKEDA